MGYTVQIIFYCPSQEYVGVVTLPNQVRQKAVKKGFVFNLMVVGKKHKLYCF